MTDAPDKSAFEPMPSAHSATTPLEYAAFSQAVSLKRIADVLEKLATPVVHSPPAPQPTDFAGVSWGQQTNQSSQSQHASGSDSLHPPVYGDVTQQREQPTAAKDWVVWSGGNCPVPPDTVVEYRMRGNGEHNEHTAIAADVYWSHRNYAGDIVAYRLAD